jgi:hypothetical protein
VLDQRARAGMHHRPSGACFPTTHLSATGRSARWHKQREAGRRHQRSRAGRFNHAARAQDYRDRRKSVTHHGPESVPRAVEVVLEPARILAMAGPDEILLEARLRPHPEHPRAAATLLEALSLWHGTMVRAALCADTDPPWFDTGSWNDALLLSEGAPLYEVTLVLRRRIREPWSTSRQPTEITGDRRPAGCRTMPSGRIENRPQRAAETYAYHLASYASQAIAADFADRSFDSPRQTRSRSAAWEHSRWNRVAVVWHTYDLLMAAAGLVQKALSRAGQAA